MTGRKAVVERFRRFAGGPEPDLFEGALLVSELVEPREDIAQVARLGLVNAVNRFDVSLIFPRFC